MITLHEWTQSLDPDYVTPLKQCLETGKVSEEVTCVEDMADWERLAYDKECSNQRRHYRVHWAKYLHGISRYRRPCYINGAMFHRIDDELDAFDNQLDGFDSSDDERQRQHEAKPDPASRTNKTALPDESKWDIVYCLPLFVKPGKHTYMIKYKNTKERSQRKMIKRDPQDVRLNPEVFFYNCFIADRKEQIPVSKFFVSFNCL